MTSALGLQSQQHEIGATGSSECRFYRPYTVVYTGRLSVCLSVEITCCYGRHTRAASATLAAVITSTGRPSPPTATLAELSPCENLTYTAPAKHRGS